MPNFVGSNGGNPVRSIPGGRNPKTARRRKYRPSPFKNSLVFTCDGKGNYKSSSLSIGKNNNLKFLK